MSKRPKTKITLTITDSTGTVLTKRQAILMLLWAVSVYAVGIFVLAAIVIVILFFIFRFNILIPLLIAVPASFLLGVLILVLKSIYDNRKSQNTDTDNSAEENN